MKYIYVLIITNNKRISLLVFHQLQIIFNITSDCLSFIYIDKKKVREGGRRESERGKTIFKLYEYRRLVLFF